ncbi:hypothetical protein Btru_039948 [Bulinus truncatus]|nr:hypothetical protein Btru_039948 [Bulinus truncatus]
MPTNYGQFLFILTTVFSLNFLQTEANNLKILDVGQHYVEFTLNISNKLRITEWKTAVYEWKSNGWIKMFELNEAHPYDHIGILEPNTKYLVQLESISGDYVNISTEFRTLSGDETSGDESNADNEQDGVSARGRDSQKEDTLTMSKSMMTSSARSSQKEDTLTMSKSMTTSSARSSQKEDTLTMRKSMTTSSARSSQKEDTLTMRKSMTTTSAHSSQKETSEKVSTITSPVSSDRKRNDVPEGHDTKGGDIRWWRAPVIGAGVGMAVILLVLTLMLYRQRLRKKARQLPISGVDVNSTPEGNDGTKPLHSSWSSRNALLHSGANSETDLVSGSRQCQC